jgi:hypothetical protein
VNPFEYEDDKGMVAIRCEVVRCTGGDAIKKNLERRWISSVLSAKGFREGDARAWAEVS